MNYTFGMSFTGNSGIATTTALGDPGVGLRLQHNADGSYSVRSDQAAYEDLMSEMGNRPHLVKVNGVWALPKLQASGSGLKALGYVVNDWQLSGVLTAGSALNYDATFLYNANGAPINLTGSSYNARIAITGDPGSGCWKISTSSSRRRLFPARNMGAWGWNRVATSYGGAPIAQSIWRLRATSRSAEAAAHSSGSTFSTCSTRWSITVSSGSCN